MSPRIIVTKRTADYHAHVEGRPELWECGGSAAEAVGKLLVTRPGMRGAEVVTGAARPGGREDKERRGGR